MFVTPAVWVIFIAQWDVGFRQSVDICISKTLQLSVKLVRIWVQIIVLNHKLPADVDTKYPKFMPLREVISITASFRRELFSFCVMLKIRS